jgi:hypothetical protein
MALYTREHHCKASKYLSGSFNQPVRGLEVTQLVCFGRQILDRKVGLGCRIKIKRGSVRSLAGWINIRTNDWLYPKLGALVPRLTCPDFGCPSFPSHSSSNASEPTSALSHGGRARTLVHPTLLCPDESLKTPGLHSHPALESFSKSPSRNRQTPEHIAKRASDQASG